MTISRDAVLERLKTIPLPDGGDPVSRDMVRALTIEGDKVRFLIEVAPDLAPKMEPVVEAARKAVEGLEGVGSASVILTAHVSDPKTAAPPPDLKLGSHPKPGANRAPIPGVERIIAVASGKGGVGKSTVASNLAVALAMQGRRVGLLDADIYGPSQSRMMGMNQRPKSPDGEKIIPLVSHGVTFMSMGLLLKDDEAVIWRGPLLVGTLQQLLGQVQWGELDVLLVDLPPGTGDVQLTLSQKTVVNGAIIVSTPQDVALLDAKKAITMFNKTNTPIVGMIENMSMYVCPKCGNEDHIFGHGGARDEAQKLGIPFLGEIPLDVSVRLASDAGRPIALEDGPVGKAYAGIARALIEKGNA